MLARVAIAGTRLAVLATLLSVASLLPWHPLPLLEHFRLQLLLGSAVVAALCALQRQAGWFDVAALCALLDLLLVTPALSGAARPGPADGAPVRLLLANVLTSNEDTAAVGRAIAELSPDVVALVEPDARWFRELAPALTGYAGRFELAHPGNFGLAIYARGELHVEVEPLGSRLPSAVARVTLAAPSRAAPFSLVLIHPIPPMDAAADAMHRSQLAAVARRAAGLVAAGQPVILAGDFNATPWSGAFAALLRDSGLYDSRDGFGVQATFPSFGRIDLLRIPIDHVLLSPQIGVRERRVERFVGSDHLPVLIELVLPRRS